MVERESTRTNGVNNNKTAIGCESRCNAQYMSLKPVPWENAKEVTIKMSGLGNY